MRIETAKKLNNIWLKLADDDFGLSEIGQKQLSKGINKAYSLGYIERGEQIKKLISEMCNKRPTEKGLNQGLKKLINNL